MFPFRPSRGLCGPRQALHQQPSLAAVHRGARTPPSLLLWRPRSTLQLSSTPTAAATPPTSNSSSLPPGAAAPLPSQPPPPSSPPPDFDLRSSLIPKTRTIISERWPALLDLVDDGTLVAVPRAPSYTERRTDGYSEPELVLLVASAHVSRASASAATRVVEAVRPDAVVLELCGSRKSVLVEEDDENEVSSSSSKASNPFALSGSIARSASLGGAPAMALRLLLARQSDAVLEAALESESESDEASTSSSFSSAFSRRPGVEARAAAAAARQVGATIVLGDRPIEITLRRAWEGLSWPERLKLGRMLFFGEDKGGFDGGVGAAGGEPLSAAVAAPSSSESTITTEAASPPMPFSSSAPPPTLQQIDALSRDPTSLAAVVASLDSELPALSRALVHERDEWLSWSLARSRAVCGAGTVVGVLGAGHVRGVAWRLAQGDRCRPRFNELAGVGGSGIGGENGGNKKKLSREERAARRIAIEVGIAVALGVAWEAWKR